MTPRSPQKITHGAKLQGFWGNSALVINKHRSEDAEVGEMCFQPFNLSGSPSCINLTVYPFKPGFQRLKLWVRLRSNTKKFTIISLLLKFAVTHNFSTPEQNFHFRSEQLFCGHTRKFSL